MDTVQKREVQFITPSFTLCTVCDAQYPPDTAECPKCKSPLSSVRKCPQCERILSAKHEKCLYCSTSFISETSTANAPQLAPIAIARGPNPQQRRRAILVSVTVFLVVMFVGLYLSLTKSGKTEREIAATAYVLRSTSLKLQPSATAGTSQTLAPSKVVSLTGIAVDPEGHRWYVLREGGADRFLEIADVAPPKVRLPELGSQMLRAWLLTFKDPSLIPEADSAVTYFCASFPSSAHCEELRWLAALRFRALAQQQEDSDAIDRTKRLYQAIIDAKGSNAEEASRALNELNGAGEQRVTRSSPRSRRAKSESLGSGREYALIDHAEVHVKIPDLKTFANASQVKAPIAREIRINGEVAVPSNATCILKVIQSNSTKDVEVQLTAIEFGKKHYDVATAPKLVPRNGATVVFPLESSLLIGKQ